MLSPAMLHADDLPPDHPCFGCEVRSGALCRVLDREVLASYRRLGWTIRARAGEAVFHQGDEATRVFTLTRGSMKVYRLLPDGRRQVVGFLLPGDFLGVTVDDEHGFTVEALEDSELCGFPRSRFGEFVETHPEMERELYRVTAQELAAAQQQMVLLGRKTAEERVASFFLELADRRPKMGVHGRRMIELPMSRSDIADYLGLTKETVSRVLGLLKSRRIVRLEAMHRIELLDEAGLVSIAEGLCERQAA